MGKQRETFQGASRSNRSLTLVNNVLRVFLKATSILLTTCLPHNLNSVNLQGWSHFFERERRGASLSRAVELCWLCSSLAGAQRAHWAAHNSPSSACYRRALSQSPSRINFGAIHLSRRSNVSQVSLLLLHTIESHPMYSILLLHFSPWLNLLSMCCAAFLT